MANDTMKIAGDIFTITSDGECAAGPLENCRCWQSIR